MTLTHIVYKTPSTPVYGQSLTKKTIGAGFFESSYAATSYGDAIGSTGLRVWDAALKPASSSHLVTPSSPLVLPFSNANLPAVAYDAIIAVTIDGVNYVYGFSNSQDSADYDAQFAGSSTSASTRILTSENLYWTNLCRLRSAGPPASGQSSYAYYFGGDPIQYVGSSQPNLLKLNLLNPVTVATTFNYTISYVRTATGGGTLAAQSGSLTVQPGSNYRNLNLGNCSTAQTGIPKGYYKITVTCSDPTYKSVLPFYHWGINL
jgi:hypothetical protein